MSESIIAKRLSIDLRYLIISSLLAGCSVGTNFMYFKQLNSHSFVVDMTRTALFQETLTATAIGIQAKRRLNS